MEESDGIPRSSDTERQDVRARLSRRTPADDLRSAAALLGDWALVVLTAWVSIRAARLDVYLLAVWIIAGRQIGLTNLGHEAAHRRLFRNPVWNDRIAQWLAELPLLYTLSDHRRWHMPHHRHLNGDEDPIAAYYLDAGLTPTSSRGRRLWLIVVKPILGYAGLLMFRGLWEDRRERLPCLLLWVPALGLAAALGGLQVVLLYWAVPLVWMYPVFEWWSGILDHFDAPSGTRNTTGLLALLFTHGHNSGYHWVHHQYPDISWNRLPEGDRLLAPPDRDAAHGLPDIVRQLFRQPPGSAAQAPIVADQGA
jgi:fatty acid desaturase